VIDLHALTGLPGAYGFITARRGPSHYSVWLRTTFERGLILNRMRPYGNRMRPYGQEAISHLPALRPRNKSTTV
jgi:hypothetical protein